MAPPTSSSSASPRAAGGVVSLRGNAPLLDWGGGSAGTVPETQEGKTFTYGVPSSSYNIVQELCESRGGRPGLSVLTSLLVSVDVKIYCTVLRHWSQLVPNMSHDI